MPMDFGVVDPETNVKFTRYIKLEAAWIFANLAYGPLKLQEQLFLENYGLVKYMNSIFESEEHDEMMLENILRLIANAASTSTQIQDFLLNYTKVLDCINRYMEKLFATKEIVKTQAIELIIWTL